MLLNNIIKNTYPKYYHIFSLHFTWIIHNFEVLVTINAIVDCEWMIIVWKVKLKKYRVSDGMD